MKSSKAFIAFLGLVHSRKYALLLIELVQPKIDYKKVLSDLKLKFAPLFGQLLIGGAFGILELVDSTSRLFGSEYGPLSSGFK